MNSETDVAKDEALIEEAYERVKDELAALTPETLVKVNLEVQIAVSTILGALPEIKELRERMVKELPAFDVASFDKLEDYTLALAFAQAKFQFATEPADGELEVVSTEAARLREKLLANAQALALSGLFDRHSLEQLKGANGYKNVAQDLQALSTALRANWANIQGKSPLQAEDVQAASRIALRLTRIVGLREQGPALLAAAMDLRMRAFTRVFQTYEDARSAVEYLRRREGDADSIAPSLYAGKGRRRSNDEPVTETAAAPATVPASLAADTPASDGHYGAPVTANAPAGTSAANDSTSPRGPFM